MDAGAKLSERDVRTKFITPALVVAGWDVQTQIREEVGFTKGCIIVRGRLVTRGNAKRADYVLYYKHLPLALIEAKDQSHNTVGRQTLTRSSPHYPTSWTRG